MWIKILVLCVLLFTGCYRVPDKIVPQINYTVQDRYIKQLPTSFPTLSKEEQREEWGKEYVIAQKFSRELDLYRAITAFKRAEFLLPQENQKRREELQYQILLCYYLGKRYVEVIHTFDTSCLYHATPSFPVYHDLLIVMYESYVTTSQPEKARYILQLIQHHYPETAKKLELSTALIKGECDTLRQAVKEDPLQLPVITFVDTYETKKKSVSKTQWANALIPGAGYLYIGQKQSALTSFLLNAFFIYAATYFYSKGNIAAGVITTSLELGWYFGGIYGGGEAANRYNEWLYKKQAYPLLVRNKLFPILMLQYGF